MKLSSVLALWMLIVLAVPVVCAEPEAGDKIAEVVVTDQNDLSQFIYTYGTVLKVSPTEIIIQEYDYDSDIEKEVVYQLDASLKIEGFKALNDLIAEDVVEVYYSEQDGKKVAKIIRREIIEEDNASPENP